MKTFGALMPGNIFSYSPMTDFGFKLGQVFGIKIDEKSHIDTGEGSFFCLQDNIVKPLDNGISVMLMADNIHNYQEKFNKRK